jgi:hypothetical protein
MLGCTHVLLLITYIHLFFYVNNEYLDVMLGRTSADTIVDNGKIFFDFSLKEFLFLQNDVIKIYSLDGSCLEWKSSNLKLVLYFDGFYLF